MIIKSAIGAADFDPIKMAKVHIASGEHLFAGLNCFEPGQQHAAHTHADQDKIYLVLAGEGEASVGDQKELVGPGALIFAAAGVPHGMRNTSDTRRLVVVTVMGPPPPAPVKRP